MEENRPEKVAKTEENSTITQETVKKQETSEENAVMEDKKIISDEKAEMAVDQKTEEADSSQGKAPMAEDQIEFRDYDEAFDKFLLEKWPAIETNVDQSWAVADHFFMNLDALDVYTAYTKALRSKNIEKLGRALETHGEFSGILVIICMQCYRKCKKTELNVLQEILYKYVIESELDVCGFTEKYDNYGLLENFQPTLQRGMWHVMFIFDQAADVDKPVDMVADTIVDAYESQLWGEEVFSALYNFLRFPNVSVLRVAFVIVTALTKICKQESNQKLLTVIHKTKIVEAVSKIVEVEKRAVLCAKVLADMSDPSESVSLIAADSASGKATELEKQVQ